MANRNRRYNHAHLASRFRHLFVKKKRIMGSLTRSLNNQDVEFARWFIAQIPEGSTGADLLITMAVDEFNLDCKVLLYT